MRWKCSLLLILSLTTVFGCSDVIRSERVELLHDNPLQTASSHYYLPKARVRFEASRTAPATLDNQKSTKTTTSRFDNTVEPAPTLKSMNFQGETTEQVIADKTTNPEGLCTLQLKDVLYEPDRDYLYRIEHERHWLASDKIKVSTTPVGFLAKIDISAEDKTPEFAQKFGELAKEAAKAAAALSAMRALGQDKKPFLFSVLIDPTDDDEVQGLNAALDAAGCPLLLEVTEPATIENYSTEAAHRKSAAAVFYRPALPYKVTIRDDGRGTQPMLIENVVHLPNKAPVLALDLKRVAFGKYTHVLQFENGMLKEVEFEIPSSGVGLMSIPIELAKAIASIPGEVLKLKFDVTSADKKLLDEQAGLAKSQKELLQSQEELKRYIEELRNSKGQNASETVE